MQNCENFVKMDVLYVNFASKITLIISNALIAKLKICLYVNNVMKILLLFCRLKERTISKTDFAFNALTIYCKLNLK